ncbi:MAG: hypothetical protein ACI83B_003857 [Sediminicola sp.]|jgi:hypothetical protein|tara:strand:+ start:625 stop:1053 length:429 start_codon:yes stop_codon:yes gene_type:complete
MNPNFKNISAVVLGWLGGSIINMGLIQTGNSLFPISGIDPNDINAFAEIMPNLEFEYFIFPFLAHALGTFFGAIIASLIAVSKKMKFAMAIGGLFLLGGIIINFMLPGPAWFAVADILLAYIPMAWLGGKIGVILSRNNARS